MYMLFQEEKARKEEVEARKKADDDAKKKNILSSLSFTGYKVRRLPFCRRQRRGSHCHIWAVTGAVTRAVTREVCQCFFPE